MTDNPDEQINYIEMDFEEAIHQLFSNPNPPDSIHFEIMEMESDQNTPTKILQQALLRGARIKYNKYNLSELSETELHTLNRYLRALGYEAYIEGSERERTVIKYDSSGQPYSDTIRIPFTVPVTSVSWRRVN